MVDLVGVGVLIFFPVMNTKDRIKHFLVVSNHYFNP